MSMDKLKDLLDSFASSPVSEEVAGYYKDSTFSLVSTVAYLIGVPQRIFESDTEPPEIGVLNKLNGDKNARIIRNLCRLRTAIERNYGKIRKIMSSEFRGLAAIPEYVPPDK
jgi:hypothetical protein